MPPIPVEADAPPDLVTPLTASAAASASQARRSSSAVDGIFAVEQIEIREIARQQRRIGEADIFVVGRDPRHGDGALGKLSDAIAADVVGRDHRLALSHQYPQSDVVAFRAFGFLDASVAHLDALRNAAHRHRVGGIRAGAPRRLDEALRQRAQRGLVEQIGTAGFR